MNNFIFQICWLFVTLFVLFKVLKVAAELIQKDFDRGIKAPYRNMQRESIKKK